MKQYTTLEQTAKLIELGFERPKSIEEYTPKEALVCLKQRYAYSIGELIEMLPRVVEDEDSEYATISIYHDTMSWVIDYQSPERCFYATSNIELVDALYEMVVKLKEEGVI